MQGAFGHNADHCNADVHHLDAGYYADCRCYAQYLCFSTWMVVLARNTINM